MYIETDPKYTYPRIISRIGEKAQTEQNKLSVASATFNSLDINFIAKQIKNNVLDTASIWLPHLPELWIIKHNKFISV